VNEQTAPVAEPAAAVKHKPRQQRTLARPAAEAVGVGLHTGEKVTVRVKPAPVNTGVVFVRTDVPGYARIPARAEYRAEIPRRTALAKDGAQVHTIEHLLSAAYGLGLDNLEVELDGLEVPGLDGSAKGWLEVFEEAGVHEQDAKVEEIVISEPVGISHGGASLVALPYDGLRVSYTLDYPGDTVPSMHFSCEINRERYTQDIASARTFVLRREAEALLAAGLGKGANTDNTVVIDDNGEYASDLRLPHEPVRHKILDILGDLALLGAPLRAHVIAVKSGHELNVSLVSKILERNQEYLQEAEPGASALDIRDITRILPHRYPFLLVDRVVEVHATRAVGIKNVTYNEPFFQGHFPGQPVMPGVLLIEAAAQVTGAMLLGTREHAGKLAYLLGVDNFKFRKTVIPGDRLVIESEAIRVKERTGQARVKATVDNHVVCEGVLKFMLIDTTDARSKRDAAAEGAAG
jgi:UDP-3-O-[3-hydroxymyristoyl] N-acetylglucosamine deacetylase / 3-hydroxyacyl-[acyl-carrier-protein] dehydratase